MHPLFRFCLAVATAGLLLAGCTISSDKPLVNDAEAVTPLPDHFTFLPYEQGDGGYVRSADAAVTFTRKGKHYLSTDIPDTHGTIDISLLPLGKDYLLAAAIPDTPGVVYAFAHYDDGVFAVNISPDETTWAAVTAAKTAAKGGAAAAFDTLAVDKDTDAITVKSRPALDALAKLYLAGSLPMGKPSVAFITPDPTAKPPSKIVEDGGAWTAVP